MAIVVKVTPRKIERTIFVILILLFMSTTVYYAYKIDTLDCDPAVITSAEPMISASDETVEDTSETLETETSPAETPQDIETQASDESSDDTSDDSSETPSDESTPNLSGQLQITLGPIKHEVRTSGVFEKAVVEQLTFIIRNGLAQDVTLKCNVYFWDSSSTDGFKEGIKDTIDIPTVNSGNILTRTFDVANINMYNLELTKTMKFEFVDVSTDEVLQTKVQTLDLS